MAGRWTKSMMVDLLPLSLLFLPSSIFVGCRLLADRTLFHSWREGGRERLNHMGLWLAMGTHANWSAALSEHHLIFCHPARRPQSRQPRQQYYANKKWCSLNTAIQFASRAMTMRSENSDDGTTCFLSALSFLCFPLFPLDGIEFLLQRWSLWFLQCGAERWPNGARSTDLIMGARATTPRSSRCFSTAFPLETKPRFTACSSVLKSKDREVHRSLLVLYRSFIYGIDIFLQGSDARKFYSYNFSFHDMILRFMGKWSVQQLRSMNPHFSFLGHRSLDTK